MALHELEVSLLRAIAKVNLSEPAQIENDLSRVDQQCCIALLKSSLINPQKFLRVVKMVDHHIVTREYVLDETKFNAIVEKADFSSLMKLELVKLLRNPYDMSRIACAINTYDPPAAWKEEITDIALRYHRDAVLKDCVWTPPKPVVA